MATILYPRFLEDEEQYALSRRFWTDLFASVVAAFDNAADWGPWRARAYANGVPFERDGNPIFDARSLRSSKAVQVIQWPSETGGVEISAWISELHLEGEDEPAVLHELTINCSLSTESAEIAKDLLRYWVDESMSARESERVIKKMLASHDAGAPTHPDT